MLARASIAASLFVAGAAASAAVPLDDLLGFDDPYRCAPTKDFDALMNGLVVWREAGETYAGVLAAPTVPAAFREQVGTARLAVDGAEYRVTLPLRGTWQGLPLRALVVVQRVESEGGFSLVFDAGREQVLHAANAAGFRIPPSGGEHRDDEVLGVNVGVDDFDGGAALSCFDG